jgi:sulfopyruvate decarboxylase alpha subunit
MTVTDARPTSMWQETLARDLLDAGADAFAVVPDARVSATAEALRRHGAEPRLLPREEECVGFAAGHALAGGKPVVLMQCSGLGNCGNALGSLAIPYGLGLVLVLSMRGTLGEGNPAQVPMGKATHGILDALGIQRFSVRSPEAVGTIVKGACTLAFETGAVAAIVLEPELGGRREYD